MRSFLSKYKHLLLLVFVFVVSEILVNPIGDFPLNDDWCYGKAVYYSLLGDFTIGGFGAMTLASHVVWGMLFAKVFGFTFTVLRFSTLISSFIGLFYLNKLVVRISGNKTLAFCVCLVLLFNPLYFNLTNTYMTDVNFNTLVILACYSACLFFEKGNVIYFFLFMVLSVVTVLLRQYGIILPVCFAIACIALRKKKWLWFFMSLLGVVLVYLVFKRYEEYLRTILPRDYSYKFSGTVKPFDGTFWENIFTKLEERYKVIFLNLFVYTAPLAILFQRSLRKNFSTGAQLLIVFICSYLVFNLFKDKSFVSGNVFTNMSLGPETFYESLKAEKNHNYSDWFSKVIGILNFLLPTVTLSVFSMYLLSLFKSKTIPSFNTNCVFLFALIVSYVFMVLVTESFFDRYHLPLITVMLIVLSYLGKEKAIYFKFEGVLILIFVVISVLGTKDYLTWNRKRWEAYNFIRTTAHTNARYVNAGFEVNCWNDAKGDWWANYTVIKPFKYLIQFSGEKEFELLKEYTFQRYFPYRKDKIGIFIRTTHKQNNQPVLPN